MPSGELLGYDEAEFEIVVKALDDEDCREIIRYADGSVTANDLSDETDIPLSTLYRKLELLSDATLLDESMQLRRDGKHTAVYSIGFNKIVIDLGDDREFELEVKRPREDPGDRIAHMWSEVREGV